jgi:PHD/YefM family antitoxin component YafN of YafNO toxin-antitoxin module
MNGFMMSPTIEQVQTEFDQAIEFVRTDKPLTITEDGEPKAMLFPSKKAQNCCACVM